MRLFLLPEDPTMTCSGKRWAGGQLSTLESGQAIFNWCYSLAVYSAGWQSPNAASRAGGVWSLGAHPSGPGGCATHSIFLLCSGPGFPGGDCHPQSSALPGEGIATPAASPHVLGEFGTQTRSWGIGQLYLQQLQASKIPGRNC